MTRKELKEKFKQAYKNPKPETIFPLISFLFACLIICFCAALASSFVLKRDVSVFDVLKIIFFIYIFLLIVEFLELCLANLFRLINGKPQKWRKWNKRRRIDIEKNLGFSWKNKVVFLPFLETIEY